jgi:hypothetical protein
MQQLQEPNALRMTAQEVDLARTKSITHYKKIKKNDRELRQTFRRQVNTRRAHKYNTSIEAQEKVTKNAFRSKGAWKRINCVLAKKERAAITFVEYTDEFDITHESTDTDSIYQACSKEGLARYGQCYDTPFMQPPLQTDFGFLGNQTAIDQVLDGTYQCPPDTPEYVIKFIQELRRPPMPAPTEVTGHATTKEHIKGWKQMRTHTAASTFGPSFSEFIAGTSNNPVAEVDAAIVSIPAAAGYCPLRWSTAIDVMIPKQKRQKTPHHRPLSRPLQYAQQKSCANGNQQCTRYERNPKGGLCEEGPPCHRLWPQQGTHLRHYPTTPSTRRLML